MSVSYRMLVSGVKVGMHRCSFCGIPLREVEYAGDAPGESFDVCWPCQRDRWEVRVPMTFGYGGGVLS
jgi:hypothetical protein